MQVVEIYQHVGQIREQLSHAINVDMQLVLFDTSSLVMGGLKNYFNIYP